MSRVKNRKNINPALRIRDFYSFGLQVINEINFARMHPDEFVQKLEELRSSMRDDNCLYLEGIPFLYSNLKGSLDDAIRFLKSKNPLPGIAHNKTITQACDYLLDEIIIHDGLDDNKSEKYSLETRLQKFGVPLGQAFELIDYGMFDPEFIVINFILCDGDPMKYERKVLFNPKIKCVGIASSLLPSDKICTVIDFCEDFYDKNENIPLEVQTKYKRTNPSFNTKTIKNYVETGQPIEKEFVDNDFDDYDSIQRKNSGSIFSMKRNQFKQKKDEFKQQRGGNVILKSEPKDSAPKYEDEYYDEEYRDDGVVIRKKRTLHQPQMEVIEEEKPYEAYDREFRIEPKRNYIAKPTSNTNSKTETKYVGDKKITTTTTTKTETGGGGEKKVTTTTITEEVGGGEPRYRNKFVKDIPFRTYGKRQFEDPKDDFEKEMRELEKNFESEFGNFNFKSPIKPTFDATDDMFEREDEIDLPPGAVSVEVKQKTITDSRGKPVLIVHKTVNYENGEKKTFIEKKNIVKK